LRYTAVLTPLLALIIVACLTQVFASAYLELRDKNPAIRPLLGEWGKVCVKITNVDCAKRVNVNLKFENIPGDYLDELVQRAKPMLEIKLIENYTIQIRG